ncbi:MAG: hypothetical protein BroJett040_19220 [Oligoflexia bacterium]|nr:MAG: hypothetical protein BroJett040_19220 [Oligoflexia bacterium]
MKQLKYRRRPQRSLRTILTIWFLLLSIAPLAFVTGYSVIKYEKGIDHELSQRLAGNAREISIILSEFKANLQQRRDRYLADPAFIYHLSTNELGALREKSMNWMGGEISTTLSFFNRTGKMVLSLYRDEKSEIKEFQPPANGVIYLSEENLNKIKNVKEYAFVELTQPQKISLIIFSKVTSQTGKTVGYIEQLVDLDSSFLEGIKERMKLEVIVLRKNGNIVVGTHPDFYEYKKDFFESHVNPDSNAFFELTLRGNPHGFVMYPIRWGQSDFFIALGASKGDAKAILRNVNYAFYSVVGAVIVLLVLSIIIISNAVLKPLDDLVQASQFLQSSDQPVEIPIKSDTEIGLLTESFNEMSRHILRVRAELKAKIHELEMTNKDLKETQSRLVHSSKMSSLGQLVAGVAHELNNPIGFIYSNMTHLREYGNRLIQYAEMVEKDPARAAEIKKQLDIDYVKTDLPKLITSCEDGARRTRDIVMGLRNFSRLEEAKLKEIDLHEAIDNTLSLLSGEIKNRIQIHKYYGDIPLVTCYASQLNQVFMNILSNAVHAIEGNGNIWITTQKVTKNNKPMISISFQDSGKGMTPEVMEKIFDPFFSTKGVGQGTGLGLSISYGIIETHGGEIQVKSQVGVGTEFVITIPIKAEVHPDQKNQSN